MKSNDAQFLYSCELFCFIRHSDEEISFMAVSVNAEPALSIGKPKELFRGNFVSGYAESVSYDIDPNGERFLINSW